MNPQPTMRVTPQFSDSRLRKLRVGFRGVSFQRLRNLRVGGGWTAYFQGWSRGTVLAR